MIKSITINDIKNLPIRWANKVQWLNDNVKTPIEFTDGINLIVGSNGSGKTSLIKMLAYYLHCEQGGYSKITTESIDNLVEWTYSKPTVFYDGATVEHDGQICFYSGDRTVGLNSGQFDDDFLRQGIQNLMDNQELSSGQKTMNKLDSVFRNIDKENIEGRNLENMINPVWKEKYLLSIQVLDNPTIKKGKKTLLLDEPDMNLDYVNQLILFKQLQTLSEHFQIIMTAHSLASVLMKDVNVIETTPDYYSKVQQQLKKLTL